ncbi:protein DGS1, mitochondrial isoform X2 [Durio zibethinus]|uniref:Protein DGS1, mitochondrial isoform X2 n=1 Tax=Durio zibethinus TaxID=66656 RepID=A0A6P5ZJ65_DURZI|nr:protein DGS1, mitochondrial isoform X2 [Durio zibethinus]
MEATPGGNESSRDVKTLISFYSNFLWNRLSTLIRSSPSIFLQKISNLSRQTTLPISTTRRAGLPLPLPSNSFNFTPTTPEASRVYEVLNDIMDRSILNLHKIQNNLQFWQSRAEGSNARKVYFMIFERGPRAFVNGTVQLIHESVADGSAMQHLSHSASAYISERIAVLSALRCSVSTFLAEVAKHQKPRKLTRNWIQYTCGAVGLSVCSFWLLRHSRLMGSSDIDNWIREAKESTVSFFNDHVEQPLLSIRDELLDTFKKRQKGVMDMEEVQLTSNSLHRMLLAFSEQTNGKEFLESASDQEMLEIVMLRYEKELMHPIQNLLNGELARALLIQVQKLKLDIEMAMLELDQILRANEINFAILAALPAFFLSLGLVVVVRAWLRQDTRAAGRGRIARIQRRLLIVEVEKTIMQYQTYVDQGLENDAQCMFGMLIYCLDRLYHAVRRHAKATGEWQCLKQDIIDLGKPDLQTAYKLIVTTRMERVYDCLLPSLKRQ